MTKEERAKRRAEEYETILKRSVEVSALVRSAIKSGRMPYDVVLMFDHLIACVADAVFDEGREGLTVVDLFALAITAEAYRIDAEDAVGIDDVRRRIIEAYRRTYEGLAHHAQGAEPLAHLDPKDDVS